MTGRLRRWAQVGTAVLLLLALFGNWLLPWERWTDLQRDAWIGAVIVAGFTMILTDKRASL